VHKIDCFMNSCVPGLLESLFRRFKRSLVSEVAVESNNYQNQQYKKCGKCGNDGHLQGMSIRLAHFFLRSTGSRSDGLASRCSAQQESVVDSNYILNKTLQISFY